MSLSPEIIHEFLVETHDSLGRVAVELVELEKGQVTASTLASVFRSVHSLKGSAGFLGFQKLESLTHVAEGLLSRLRDGKLTVSVEIVSALLATIDAVREILRSIEFNGRDGDQTYPELIARLKALMAGEPSASAKIAPFEKTIDFVPTDSMRPESTNAPASESPPSVKRPRTRKQKPAPASASVFIAHDSGSQILPTRFNKTTVSPPISSDVVVSPSESSKAVDSTIRLGVERVDQMMNLVTELVLSRNQILQSHVVQATSSLAAAARNLNLITSELQESVMRMRMQPINNVWATLPRVVRDLSLDCGKQVRLVLEGAETELDKSVLEAIKDPLMHLVRNSIDHGFETPDIRKSRGKPAEGSLRLRAFHESGHVHIEISDDGAGIDRARVKAKAREKGLITAEQVESLTDESVLSLIFLPGFSTREAVSSLSGRGVGMDVVQSNVKRIGGSVDILSTPGVGSTFKLRIPLTLAIIHALLVTCNGERFAVPQTNMIELIRLGGDHLKTKIEQIHGVRVLRYRGTLLPLVSLTQILGGSEESESESVSLIVLQANQRQFGLIVDRVNDTQEIVVKPLHKILRSVSCLAGATILGDGQVALILDVTGLAEHAFGEMPTQSSQLDPAESADPHKDMQQVVLVSGPRGERLAVPLAAVARLEEFPLTKVEWTGKRPVIQYRDQILPLVDVMGQLGQLSSETSNDAASMQVVVCTDGTNRMGLVVGRILDIVTDPLLVRAKSDRDHVLYTAVVQRQVTEVLNVHSLIAASGAELLVTSGGRL